MENTTPQINHFKKLIGTDFYKSFDMPEAKKKVNLAQRKILGEGGFSESQIKNLLTGYKLNSEAEIDRITFGTEQLYDYFAINKAIRVAEYNIEVKEKGTDFIFDAGFKYAQFDGPTFIKDFNLTQTEFLSYDGESRNGAKLYKVIFNPERTIFYAQRVESEQDDNLGAGGYSTVTVKGFDAGMKFVKKFVTDNLKYVKDCDLMFNGFSNYAGERLIYALDQKYRVSETLVELVESDNIYI